MDAIRFGYWSAIAAFVFSVGYGIPQILQVGGVLHFPLDEILIFAPSLALAPSFVLAMAGLHATRASSLGVWSLAALALSVMYATLVSIVYSVQLAAVIPAKLAGGNAVSALFGCCAMGNPLTAVDLLGYTLMSLATLIAAPALPARSALRRSFIANGLLAPFLVLQTAWPGLIWIGALWLLTFPLAMALLALDFRRMTPASAIPPRRAAST
ncbi:hypothetical protein LB518_03635 [Mesorhizobium sp. BR1-1-16]|uniref:hypothetical protein n=1 Tax=Mesorhizobium sp. BR1-1-16 TaxID=2876653 RepID=UPI001CCA5349|nr:hypothetical protein [Mesorhizobium sp. BR1-1-16]MBZ9935368.1 hypothetical protein [Mesorhizobium sp. BR1-1-16]